MYIQTTEVEVIPEEPKEMNEMMKMDLTMSGSKTVQIVIWRFTNLWLEIDVIFVEKN